MGIVTSTLASLAIRIAWNCQRFLDSGYRCTEAIKACDVPQPTEVTDMTKSSPVVVEATPMAAKTDNDFSHKENRTYAAERLQRNRRIQQLKRQRKRPSSYDSSFITRDTGIVTNHANGIIHTTCNGVVYTTEFVNSMSTPTRRQFRDLTSSSGCSSDCSSDRDSDSEIEARRLETRDEESDVRARRQFGMSADEEAAFRLTVGRGHFSRSKKDRFLNHLRLEKKLNGLNKELFEVACLAHSRTHWRQHPHDLRRIV